MLRYSDICKIRQISQITKMYFLTHVHSGFG
jgi:hypothetical protein